MTSTDIVRTEIERFLKSTEPEVLCVTGAWGVGKTYMWQSILDQQRRNRAVGLHRYSYASLFGIGSLEALKSSIVENMEFLVPEGTTGFDVMKSGGNVVFKQAKKLMSVAGAIPYVGDTIVKGQYLLFNTVRAQIVCVDDLERKGAVSVKDVFGLVSFLREQRGCKVVLLLNKAQLDEIDAESKREFDGYFEKVIDAQLVFAPTSAEALAIAISGRDALSVLISEHCLRLSISNIRVIKKIERMIRMIEPLVTKRTDGATCDCLLGAKSSQSRSDGGF